MRAQVSSSLRVIPPHPSLLTQCHLPPRGKAFALGQAAKVDRRELHPRNRTVYMAIQPKAFATELARMIAAKMGHSQRIIKLNTGLRRNR